MSQRKPPQPPKPVYSEAEKEVALLEVIRYVLEIPESRLKPKAANNGEGTRHDQK